MWLRKQENKNIQNQSRKSAEKEKTSDIELESMIMTTTQGS